MGATTLLPPIVFGLHRGCVPESDWSPIVRCAVVRAEPALAIVGELVSSAWRRECLGLVAGGSAGAARL